MKRGKAAKAVGKKRKSLVQCLSPRRTSISRRRNPVRSIRKNILRKSLAYESPLNHLRHRGDEKSPVVKSKKKEIPVNDQASEETADLDNSGPSKDILPRSPMMPKSPMMPECQKEIYNESVIVVDDVDAMDNRENINLSILGKDSKYIKNLKRKPYFDWSSYDSALSGRGKKLRQSILPNVEEESASYSENVIVLNDTVLEVDETIQPGKNKSINLKESTNSTKTSTDVIEIDCTMVPSTSFSSPAPHNKNCTNKCSTENDTIIILDENSEETVWNKVPSKPVDDCCVVWSSMPEKSPETKSDAEFDDFLNNYSFVDSTGDYIPLESKTYQCKPLYRVLKTTNRISPPKPKLKSSKVKCRELMKEYKRSKKDELRIRETKERNGSQSSPERTKISRSEKGKETRRSKNKKIDSMLIHQASINNNSPQPSASLVNKASLREIVVDGTNVAMAYTHNKTFSEKGIKMLIDYFTKRGHVVKVFIPQHRRSFNFPLLEKWYTEGIVVFTPSRKLGGKSYTPYDDRYILEYATACDGIVVSQDQYRDLYQEQPRWRDTIEKRLLVPTFVGDYVMFPEDPLGRFGPTLEEFLKR